MADRWQAWERSEVQKPFWKFGGEGAAMDFCVRKGRNAAAMRAHQGKFVTNPVAKSTAEPIRPNSQKGSQPHPWATPISHLRYLQEKTSL